MEAPPLARPEGLLTLDRASVPVVPPFRASRVIPLRPGGRPCPFHPPVSPNLSWNKDPSTIRRDRTRMHIAAMDPRAAPDDDEHYVYAITL